MLNEEALLLILSIGACGLVILGTLELLWPTRPRHPRGRPVTAREMSRRAALRAATPAATLAPTPPSSPLLARRPARVVPPAAPPPIETRVEAPSPSPAPSVAPEPPEPVPVVPAPPLPDPVAAEPTPTVAAAPEPTATYEPEVSVVERGFALLKEQRLGEVVTLAERELKIMRAANAGAPAAGSAQDAARLWGLVGLAKQGLDDSEGARFAFEEAIATASGSERATWEGHLVALTLAVGRRALNGQGTASPADRVASLTSAIEWLERGLTISPSYPALREVVTAAREALWGAHEAVVNDLLQRRETAGARRALEDVIADPECPPERRLAFCRLLDGLNASGPA